MPDPDPDPELELDPDVGEPVADPTALAGNDDPEQPSATDGRAARAERRRVKRRHAILEAAKRVFRDKGYHQASVHDIIDEARIARGTFYLYFPSKQELFGELVAEFLQALRTQVKLISLAPGAPEPLDQLHANFRRVVTTVLAQEDVASIILRHPVGFDEESGAKVNLFFEQVLQMVEDALRVGQSLGLLRACDTHIVAAASLGGLREALSRMLMADAGELPVGPRESFRDPTRLADELMAFFLRGLFK
ncbi:MAG: TetR/AcrR family transcriptional regulator [Myxococcales bacterium]|nr:TetR/AcrR family transcriptional regulator [Myxococcales bacterium]